MAMFTWIWSKLKAFGRWLYENPIALAASVGTIIGAYFMWKSNKNKIGSLEDALAVEATKKKIAKAEAKAEILEKQASEKDPEVERLKKEVSESQRRVLEIHEGQPIKDKSDAEIADMFSKSGL